MITCLGVDGWISGTLASPSVGVLGGWSEKHTGYVHTHKHPSHTNWALHYYTVDDDHQSENKSRSHERERVCM